MRAWQLILALTAALTGSALAQTPVTDADVEAAYKECAVHRVGSFSDGYWQAGWEHCDVVWREHVARAQVRLRAPPDVSKSVANSLEKPGQARAPQ